MRYQKEQEVVHGSELMGLKIDVQMVQLIETNCLYLHTYLTLLSSDAAVWLHEVFVIVLLLNIHSVCWVHNS